MNIDLFKDLMQVLKDLVTRAPSGKDAHDSIDAETSTDLLGDQEIKYRLQCIVTAFELLSGQGKEAPSGSAHYLILKSRRSAEHRPARLRQSSLRSHPSNIPAA